MAPKGRKPGLSEEERALWRQVTRDTQPIKKPPRPAAPPETEVPEPDPPSSEARVSKTPKTASPPKIPGADKAAAKPPAPKPQAPKRAPRSLGHGDIADLDKRSAERMRRGRMAVEATLDLHGHSQDQARRELAAFLARAQGAGKRCVIVVTGKGDISHGGGVLRAQVPRWLNDPENRSRVLAFDHAQPRHGGLGALYVLLRKAQP